MTAECEQTEPKVVFSLKRKISALTEFEVESCGKWFYAYEKLKTLSHTSDELQEEESSSEDEKESGSDIELDEDIEYLKDLDPNSWKDQDHYRVLGLTSYRYKASDDDIKKAYRAMVLRHHPDKRAGEVIKEDGDYFICIQRAYEVLGNFAKRRSYDSVDPEFEDDIPSKVNPNNTDEFFEIFTPAFEMNARWSIRKHPPMLGKLDDPREKVDRFYNFWYDFDSWREFSYLDEDETDKDTNREERRWIEKQNKAERAKKKKEEYGRIRKLVDNAFNSDPRVIKFREQDKQEKIALKKAKQEAVRKRQEEQNRIRREIEEKEKREKEEEQARLKAKQDAEKKEKEAYKKKVKNEKKKLRTYFKDNDYFSENEDEKIQIMTDVELLCEALDIAKLCTFNENLQKAENNKAAKEEFLSQVSEVKNQIEREKQATNVHTKSGSSSNTGSGKKAWISSDLQLLIKAVNLFPAGTAKRWEVVAEYINQHGSGKRSAKEVLEKAKELQNSTQMKEVANKNAYQEVEKTQSQALLSNVTTSERLETPQEMLGMNLSPWSAEEQRLLEQALKTYPASTSDRWDKISECIPNRTKKDCMKRYKELVERVKAKKAAQSAVSK